MKTWSSLPPGWLLFVYHFKHIKEGEVYTAFSAVIMLMISFPDITFEAGKYVDDLVSFLADNLEALFDFIFFCNLQIH